MDKRSLLKRSCNFTARELQELLSFKSLTLIKRNNEYKHSEYSQEEISRLLALQDRGVLELTIIEVVRFKRPPLIQVDIFG